MSVAKAIFLGIVQGVTEFLPISSSGHLAVFSQNEDSFGLYMIVLMHVGTLSAILIYYRSDLASALGGGVRLLAALGRSLVRRGEVARTLAEDAGSRLALLIIVGSVPTAIVGLGLRPLAETATSQLKIVGAMFIVTGVMMYYADRFSAAAKKLSNARVRDSVVVGIFQGLAVMPGLSRSGLTIFAGLMRGMERRDAARLSFLLSVPALVGAAAVEVSGGAAPGAIGPALIAAGAAFVSGYLSLVLLIRILASRKLRYFAGYLVAMGAATLIWM